MSISAPSPPPPSSSPHSLFDALSSSLSHYSSYSLNRLEREPALLRAQQTSLEGAMHSLAIENYQVFVDSHQFLRTSQSSLSVLDDDLGRLSQGIPRLLRQTEDFQAKTQEIQRKQKTSKFLLEHHLLIHEFLEIPQLMEICVHSQLFEESLDLFHYIKDLFHRYGEKLGILKEIYEKMQETRQMMMEQLFSHLSGGNLSLSQGIRYISYLRRIDLYTEMELSQKFLHSRSKYYEIQLSSLIHPKYTNSGYSAYLMKYIDLQRIQLLEMITHYRAIFMEDQQKEQEIQQAQGNGTGQENGSSGSANGSPASSRSEFSSPAACESLLSRWIFDRISLILQEIHTILPHIDEGISLYNLLEQCMYSGIFLSRIGVDFRIFLLEEFQSILLLFYEKQLSEISIEFPHYLQQYDHYLGKDVMNKLLLLLSNEKNMDILQSPPLAMVGNIFIQAANQLRQCAPMALEKRIYESTENALMQMVAQMKAFPISTEIPSGPNALSPVESRRLMALTMEKHFLPFIQNLVQGVFSNPANPPIVGMPTSDGEKSPRHSMRIDKVAALLQAMQEGPVKPEAITDTTAAILPQEPVQISLPPQKGHSD